MNQRRVVAGKEMVVLCSHLLLHGNNHNIPSDQNQFLLASPAADNAVAWACQSFNLSSEPSKHKSDDSLSDIWALGSPWETVSEPPELILHEVPEVSTTPLYPFPSPAKETLHLYGTIQPMTPTRNSPVWLADASAYNFGWDIEKSFFRKWKIFWLKAVKMQQVVKSTRLFSVSFGRGKEKAFKERVWVMEFGF